MGQNQIFYGFIATAFAGVTAILWRNYRTWRAWNDAYKKAGRQSSDP